LNLPTGTITFLFTDIEGSTQLWEKRPDAMRLALTRHNALLQQAIDQNNGVVFKTVGDAFCAAFHTAPDGLRAAFAAQLALQKELWPEPVTIRVRMALHTGESEVRDNDYFSGPSLNRVARLMSVGHGGQVLISAATQELVRDTLLPSVSLLNLGEHGLRDLTRRENVFQLLHPDLPSEFPALKSLDHFPNNLPQQLSSFIGREKEIADVKGLLVHHRLLTTTGSGGCGKTRLALQVAAEVLPDYPHGVWLVELAPLTEPRLLTSAVAQVLGIKEQAGQTIQQALLDSLKSKSLLLLLDNCEHLLFACAQLVAALLRSCPNVKVLATSRESLGIGGEQSYRVPSLATPDLKQKVTPESLSQYEAVRLFIDRACSHKPDFAVTNANAPALAQVCQRLDCHFPPHNVPGVFTQSVPPVFTQTVPGDGKLLQQRLPLGYRKTSPFYAPEEETCQAGDCPPWIFAPYCCKFAATPVTAP
jgi:class 3 adenylate cyclase